MKKRMKCQLALLLVLGLFSHAPLAYRFMLCGLTLVTLVVRYSPHFTV